MDMQNGFKSDDRNSVECKQNVATKEFCMLGARKALKPL